MDLSHLIPFRKKPVLNREERRAQERADRKAWKEPIVRRINQDIVARKTAHRLRQERARQRTAMRKQAADAKKVGIAALPPGGFFPNRDKK